jgi:chromosome segregation ATPase
MTLTEQIYGELVDGLKTGLDWPQFLAQHGASKGPLYNAIGRFFNDMEPKARALNEVQVRLDEAGLKLNQLDQEISEADKAIQAKTHDLALLEEKENTLKKQTEVLESNLEQQSAPLEQLQELDRLGFGEERLKVLTATLAEMGTKRGLKRDESINTFFAELKDYDAIQGFTQELQRLETIIRTKTLEAERFQAEANNLSRRHKDLNEAITAVKGLIKHGVKTGQIVAWNGIVSKLGGSEGLQDKLGQYKSMSELLNARKEEAEAYGLRLTKAQSQLETLEKEKAKIEASIDALKVAGVKELKAMTEATEKQLKAMVATQIRETRVVGQGVGKELDNLLATQIKETRAVGQVVKKELDNLFAQLDALGEKAIGVGRAVGTIEEQLRRNGKARDVLNLLENPMAAAYEDYTPLVLLLAMSMRIWVSNNKDKFTLSYRVDEGLEALVKNLGGS